MGGEVRWWNTQQAVMNPGYNLFLINSVAANSILTNIQAGISLEFEYDYSAGMKFAGPSILWGIEAFDHGGGAATISQANFATPGVWLEAGRIVPSSMAIGSTGDGTFTTLEYLMAGQFEWQGYKQFAVASDVYVSFSWEGASFFGNPGQATVTGRASTYSP